MAEGDEEEEEWLGEVRLAAPDEDEEEEAEAADADAARDVLLLLGPIVPPVRISGCREDVLPCPNVAAAAVAAEFVVVVLADSFRSFFPFVVGFSSPRWSLTYAGLMPAVWKTSVRSSFLMRLSSGDEEEREGAQF